jgi:DNA-binding helix-hairpin-helix protein with protein kinase domain
MSIEAMKMALEALDIACRNNGDVGGADTHWGRWDAAMTALRQAIEQAEKPCQTGSQCIGGKCPECEREWVGLTYDEAYEFVCTTDSYKEFAQAIEAKLKEKNT